MSDTETSNFKKLLDEMKAFRESQPKPPPLPPKREQPPPPKPRKK